MAETQKDLAALERVRAGAAQLMQSAIRDTGVTQSQAGQAFLKVSFNVPSRAATIAPASDLSPLPGDPTAPDAGSAGFSLPGGSVTLPVVGSVPVLALVAAVGLVGFIVTRK